MWNLGLCQVPSGNQSEGGTCHLPVAVQFILSLTIYCTSATERPAAFGPMNRIGPFKAGRSRFGQRAQYSGASNALLYLRARSVWNPIKLRHPLHCTSQLSRYFCKICAPTCFFLWTNNAITCPTQLSTQKIGLVFFWRLLSSSFPFLLVEVDMLLT